MKTVREIVLEIARCPLGCHGGDETLFIGRDLLHDLPGEFTVVRCRACGLMRTSPRPTPQTMAFYYPPDYGPYRSTQVQPRSRTRKVLGRLLRSIFEFNTDRLPPLPPARMLEVGCASGSFLSRMAQEGWQVEGIEFSDGAAKAAADRGYKVHVGALESVAAPAAVFDLLVGWMVLEHLHDPVLGLKKLREWAKPDAWLVLSVPNANSLEFRFFKDKWYALQVPTHLHHFTPETVKKLLEATGWIPMKVHHQRVLSNLIASAGYVLRDKGYARTGQRLIDFPERSGIWSYMLYPLAWILSLFGQTGRMTIWARAGKQ